MSNALSHSPVPSTPTTHRRGEDRRLVSYVGRHGAVSIAQAMVALDLRRTTAYERIAALIDAGLLERLDLLRGEPALIRATRAGLRYAHLGGIAPALVSPGSVDHWLRCASVALDLEARHGAHRILTERELLAAERHEDRPIASAKIGELPNGRPRLHRPDLVVLPADHPLVRSHPVGTGPYVPAPVGNQARGHGEDDGVHDHGDPDRDSGFPGPTPGRRPGQRLAAHARTREQAREISGDHERAPAGAEDMGVVAIEVELTPKSPKRLREIVRGWRRASWVAEVHYLCEPGQTRRAVERAVEKLHASERVRITEVPR